MYSLLIVKKEGWNVQKRNTGKSFLIFPSQARMSLTKLSLGGIMTSYINKLFPPREILVTSRLGTGIQKLFSQCRSDIAYLSTHTQIDLLCVSLFGKQ
jgi:hypothetical protein